MKKISSDRDIIPNILMLCFGLIVLISFTYKIGSHIIFTNKAVSVYGIIDKAPAGGRSGFGGRPIVKYEDNQGNVHFIKSKVKTHLIVAPEKGEKIKVFFLKENPETAIVSSTFHHIFLPLVFIVIGLAVVFWAFINCRKKVHLR